MVWQGYGALQEGLLTEHTESQIFKADVNEDMSLSVPKMHNGCKYQENIIIWAYEKCWKQDAYLYLMVKTQ